MKKEKKVKKPVGIYGGETNGANPLEWNLRGTIIAQLRHLGWHCNSDSAGDGSGSWIEAYKEDPNKRKEGKLYSFSIEFNSTGDILTGIDVFKVQVITKLDEDHMEKIF
jgi:hypothetical protein